MSGIIVTLAIRGIEHLAFGYSDAAFLEGVMRSTPGQRVLTLSLAGLIGGCGWWAIRHWSSRMTTVEQSVAGEPMPIIFTTVNACLQVVVVGLGASIGRELAPRELSAMFAGWLAEKAGITTRERRILIACGAGAGLAAVYNVPLGGAIFAIEVLLAEVSLATVIPAISASAIATVIAWIVVPIGPLYRLPVMTVTPSLLVWSIVAGPVIGLLAVGFARGAAVASSIRPRGWTIVPIMTIVCAAVGVASIVLPAILGNGSVLTQLVFTDSTPLLVILLLVAAKSVATIGTIASGASGGTLTPALAIGACLGALLGGGWSLIWPGSPIAACAAVAAAAFLATSIRAPVTGIVLVIEFTHTGVAMLVPILIAVVGATLVARILLPATNGSTGAHR